jgi:hypothetical protein
MRIEPPRRARFDCAMRLLLLLGLLANFAAAAVPPALAAALKNFRTDGPRGWSFTQTTVADGRTRIERHDAGQPEFGRWTLVADAGKTPTDDEQRDYREKLTRRSSAGTAPRLTDQLDLSTLQLVSTAAGRTTYRCRLKPGEQGDTSARFLAATLVLHEPTQTIESLELASTGEFSPAFVVKIAEMKTTMTYSLPESDRPSLLQKVTTHLRGRAFLVKSLDADMTVTFSDYRRPALAPRGTK